MREKLIELLKESGVAFPISTANFLIANDVVPVVRCKDCKHYHHYGEDVYGCRTYGMMKTEHDGFCSYGERKDKNLLFADMEEIIDATD